jgi:hypothetical protein
MGWIEWLKQLFGFGTQAISGVEAPDQSPPTSTSPNPTSGRIQVLGPGQNELAPPVAITIVDPEAPNAAFLQVDGENARITITFMESMTPEFVEVIVNQAKSANARSAVLSTGDVINPTLASNLVARAAAGRTILGGRVVETTPANATHPQFQIIWDLDD